MIALRLSASTTYPVSTIAEASAAGASSATAAPITLRARTQARIEHFMVTSRKDGIERYGLRVPYGSSPVRDTNGHLPHYPFNSFFSSLKKRQSVPWAMSFCGLLWIFFFLNGPTTTEIYTLSLHDALPI